MYLYKVLPNEGESKKNILDKQVESISGNLNGCTHHQSMTYFCIYL